MSRRQSSNISLALGYTFPVASALEETDSVETLSRPQDVVWLFSDHGGYPTLHRIQQFAMRIFKLNLFKYHDVKWLSDIYITRSNHRLECQLGENSTLGNFFYAFHLDSIFINCQASWHLNLARPRKFNWSNLPIKIKYCRIGYGV